MSHRGTPNRSHQPTRYEVDGRWQERAACLGLPSEVFFPDQHAHITLAARRVCEGCEVRDKCLEYALSQGEWYGTWGGLSVHQRRELLRQGKTA